MAVTWNYAGSTSIQMTLDTVAAVSYTLSVVDGATNNVDTFTGTGSPMTRTVTGLSGLAAGNIFGATVLDSTQYLAADNFTYGTPTMVGEGRAGEWSFDGIDTFSLLFTGVLGVIYNLQVDYSGAGEEYGTPFTATGSPQTVSMTVIGALSGTFVGSLWIGQDTFTSQASRLFVAAVADGGSPGNPEGTGVLVPESPPPAGRVMVAFDNGPLDVNPTWTVLDQGGDFPQNFVSGYDIQSGRQTLLSQTDTGTASVYINDHKLALFDPRNVSSPYFGKLDGKQILLQLYDPEAAAWEGQFRGLIDDISWVIDGSAVGADGQPINASIQIDCVDMFDYLAGFGLTPGLDGVTPHPVPSGGTAGGAPPAGYEDGVYYAQTAGTVDDRIIEILTDVGVDSTRYTVASGNVSVKAVKYDPDESALQALRDAADAELPFIANIYCDRHGDFLFRGRYSRFNPDATAAEPGSTWDFHRWAAGDGAAIVADSTRAQLRAFAFGRNRSDLINVAICYPQGMKPAQMPNQVYADTTSITDFGKHSAPPMSDLLTNEGSTSHSGFTTNDHQECFLFAKLTVLNQKDPRENIKTLTFKAIRPDGSNRSIRTWALITRADISHIVNVAVGYPSGTGLAGVSPDDDYYIEGRKMQVRPLNPSHDYVELDLSVTPAVWSMDLNGVFPPFSGPDSGVPALVADFTVAE